MADSCHVLQSLIFMMLGHMGETHTDGIQVVFDFDISGWMLQFLYLKGYFIKSFYIHKCV